MKAPNLAGVCWSETPALVDLRQVGNVVWVVAERERRGSTPRMVAGILLDEIAPLR